MFIYILSMFVCACMCAEEHRVLHFCVAFPHVAGFISISIQRCYVAAHFCCLLSEAHFHLSEHKTPSLGYYAGKSFAWHTDTHTHTLKVPYTIQPKNKHKWCKYKGNRKHRSTLLMAKWKFRIRVFCIRFFAFSFVSVRSHLKRKLHRKNNKPKAKAKWNG